MQPQDPRRQPSVLSGLDGLAQPVQSQQSIQQPIQQAPVVQPTATDQDANLVPDELIDEIQQINKTINLENNLFQPTTGDVAIDEKIRELVNLSPDEYLKQAFQATDGKLGGDYESWLASNQVAPEQTAEYAEALKRGDKFPLPYIDLATGSQDGRNRALAAQMAGIEEIPVGIIPEMTPTEKIEFYKSQIDKYPENTYLGNKYRNDLSNLENQVSPEQPLIQEEVIQEPITEKTLLEEAKNYKNPDDYARKISDNGYLPTEVGDKLIIFKGTGAGMQFGTNNMFEYARRWEESNKNMPEGTSSFANNYRKAAEYGEVTPYIIDKKDVMNKDDYFALLAEKLGIEPSYPGFYKGYWRRADKFPDLIPEIKDMGYKAFTDTNGEIVVLDNNAVENLWNKAQPPTLRGTKKYTEADIKDQQPDIQVAKDITIKDTSGQTVELQEGENLTPYMMKDGRVVIQDGVASTISPSTLDQIQKNSVSSAFKTPFAPELKNKDIVILSSEEKKNYDEEIDKFIDYAKSIGVEAEINVHGGMEGDYFFKLEEPPKVKVYYAKNKDGDWKVVNEQEYDEAIKEERPTEVHYEKNPIVREHPEAYMGTNDIDDLPPEIAEKLKANFPNIEVKEKPNNPRHENWTIKGTPYKNYREVLITTETEYQKELDKGLEKLNNLKEKNKWDEVKYTIEKSRLESNLKYKYGNTNNFVSESHFPGNFHQGKHLESHYRMNDREWNGKKMAFLEEMQSDYARNVREKGMDMPGENEAYLRKIDKLLTKLSDLRDKESQVKNRLQNIAYKETQKNKTRTNKGDDYILNQISLGNWMYDDYKNYEKALKGKYNKLVDAQLNKLKTLENQRKNAEFTYNAIKPLKSKAPYSPTVKNWRESTLKAALIDAVDNDAEIFAWTNGTQQGKRYGLSEVVEWIDKNKYGSTFSNPNNSKDKFELRLMMKTGDIYDLLVDKTTPDLIVTSIEGMTQNRTEDLRDKPLGDIIGDDLAKQIANSRNKKQWKDEDLVIGNKSLANLYDVQIPELVKKMTKQKVKYAEMKLTGNEPYKKVKARGTFGSVLGDNVYWDDIKVGDVIDNNPTSNPILITKKGKSKVEYVYVRELGDEVKDIALQGSSRIIYSGVDPKTNQSYDQLIYQNKLSPYKIKQLVNQRQRAQLQRELNFLIESRPESTREELIKIVKKQADDRYRKLYKSSLLPDLQPYIELTPVVKAIIKGEKPPIKASGRKY